MTDMEFYRNLNNWEATLQKACENGQLTETDASMIKAFVNSKTANRGWAPHRARKSALDLKQWRRFIEKPYQECSMDDIHAGINRLKNGQSIRGKPFAANTQHDYIKVLKWFLQWGVANRKMRFIRKAKIGELKVPRQNIHTTEPNQLLSSSDIIKLTEAAKGSQYPVRDQAFIMVLYESGVRIAELSTLYWRDVTPTEYGFRLFVKDHKTQKFRLTGIQLSAPYLANWMNSYPGGADPDKRVFIKMWERRKGRKKSTNNDKEDFYGPMDYRANRDLLNRIIARSGLKKRVHCHLFRKSRITDMIRQNWQEAIVKKAMWGSVETKSLATYVVTNERDLDAEMMDRSGLKPKEESSQDNPLTPKTCIWCKTINETTNRFCSKCHRPLSDEMMKEVEVMRMQVNLAILAMSPKEHSEWLTEQINELTTAMAA